MKSKAEAGQKLNRVSTGIPTLDSIMWGGLSKGEIYLVNGEPGTGKTILALHFLEAGVRAGEKVLCIALSQRIESVRQTARSVDIDPSEIMFHELSSADALKSLVERQTVFDTSEIELEETMTAFTEAIETIKPARIIFDGISYLRMLANDSLTYRQQILTIRDYMAGKDITVLLTDDRQLAPGDGELESIAHGIISLSQEKTEYGSVHRYLRLLKLRGSDYLQGSHDLEISDRGIEVYPNWQETSDSQRLEQQQVTSGLAGLDTLIGGGLLMGTSCLLVGPSGTGKTSMATLFANNFAFGGGKVAVFLFDELLNTFLNRSQGLGMQVDRYIEKDLIRCYEIGLSNISPGKFADLVRQEVIDWGAGMVIIDTLTGYLNSMPDSKKLVAQMHELLNYLSRRGILSFLVVAQHGVVAPNLDMPIDISYLADTVLLLRHFEAEGALRQAISVYKKRYGNHERRIRELRFQPGSIEIGAPLTRFSGILSGTPAYRGEAKNLFDSHE